MAHRYLKSFTDLEPVYAADISMYLKNDKIAKQDAFFIIDTTGDSLDENDSRLFPSSSDSRFGSTGMYDTCTICKGVDCGGHNGYFSFPKNKEGERIMIAKPEFVRDIMRVLSVVCHECNGLMLNPKLPNEKEILERVKNAPKGKKLALLVALTGAQSKFQECTVSTKTRKEETLYCSTKHKPLTTGEVKSKFPFLQAKVNTPKKKPVKKAGRPKYDSDEEEEDKSKTKTYLPRQAYRIIQKIDDYDLENYLGLTREESRGMFATGALILSPKFRPDTGPDRQDDLTGALRKLFKCCQKADRDSSDIVIDLTEAYAEYAIAVRKKMKGKKGTTRGAIQGKKSDFSARTVAVPASSDVDFWEIEVPRFIADNALLMGDNFVTAETLEMYQRLMFDGIIGIVNKGSGTRDLWKPVVVGDDNFSDRSEHILAVGDRVHLRARDGDFILIGRQPTHNQQNIIGVKVKIVEGNVMGAHISITPYTHLDFDGDQMWLASLQTKEAREELQKQLSARNVIRTYQSNSAMTGLVYNATTSAALLTRPGIMVTQALFDRAIFSYASYPRLKTHMDRCLRYGVHPLSGASLFSTLLPEDFYYKGGSKDDKKDIEIRQGILIRGMITKKTAGNGGGGIVDRLILMYPEKVGYDYAVNFINDGTRMLGVFLNSVGHTITFDDCLLGRDYQPEVRKKLEEMRNSVMRMKKPETRLEEEAYEKKILGFIAKMAEVGRDKLAHTTDSDNSMIFMSELGSGTKGKKGNIYTISVSIGQQMVEGKRFASTLSDDSRCTAADLPFDIYPESKGFIVNSYVSGMTPLETWQASAGIRSGLVQTATTTHVVGWTQRFLQNATADAITENGSVVFHSTSILEWCYGGDSCDGLYLEKLSGSMQAVNIDSMVDKFNNEYEMTVA